MTASGTCRNTSWRMLQLFAAAACCVAGPSAGDALGQQAPLPKAFLQVRFGPLYLTPKLGIENIGFDNNVQNSSNEPQTAFTTTLWAGARIQLSGRILSAGADIGSGYVFYSQKLEEPTLNPGIRNAQVGLRLAPKVTLGASGRYEWVKNRPNYEIDTRARRLETDVGVGVQYALTPRLGLAVGARWSRIRYDQNADYRGTLLAATLNERRNDQGGSISYKVTPFTEVFGSVGWKQEVFDTDPSRDANAFRVGGGLGFTGRGLLSGRFEVGPIRFDVRDPSIPDYNGVYATALVRLSLRDHTALELGAGRGLAPSFYPTLLYYESRSYQAQLRRALFRGIDAGVGYQYVRNRYPVLSSSSGDDEHTRTYTISLGYVRGQSRYAVYASHWSRMSALPADLQYERPYIGWRFGFSIQTLRLSLASTAQGSFVNGTVSMPGIQP